MYTMNVHDYSLLLSYFLPKHTLLLVAMRRQMLAVYAISAYIIYAMTARSKGCSDGSWALP